MKKLPTIFFLLLTFTTSGIIFACTNIQIKAQDGTTIIARSMEYSQDMHSVLHSSPRLQFFQTHTPDGKPGLSWHAKYGYIGLDALGLKTMVDGMNEVGLSFGALLFPGFASYPPVPVGKEQQAINYIDFGCWILSNFKTVDEVRQALSQVYVYQAKLPALNNTIFPLHYIVADARGKSLIIEYTAGKMHLYENNTGVFTNSPPYPWHSINLVNYLNLSPVNPKPVKVDNVVYAATGLGYGMTGLPGDNSPPARFVKSAILLHVAVPPNNATEAVNLAQHLMNNVDIPRGESRELTSGNYIDDTTQWVVFKDLKHKIFYYRTYDDLALHAVYLNKIDFSAHAPHLKMPIASQPVIHNVTEQFLATGYLLDQSP